MPAYPSEGWLSKSSAASLSKIHTHASQAEATLTCARARLKNLAPDFVVAEVAASARPRSISPENLTSSRAQLDNQGVELPVDEVAASARPRSWSPRPKLSLSAGMAAGGAGTSSPSTPQRGSPLQPSRLSRFNTPNPKAEESSPVPVSYAMQPAAGKTPSENPQASRQLRAAARPLSRSPSAREAAPKVSWAAQKNNANVKISRGRSSSRGPGPSRGVPSVFPRSLSPAAN